MTGITSVIANKSLAELASSLNKGELSSVELSKDCLTNIKLSGEQDHNIFISLAEEDAIMAEAENADEDLQSNKEAVSSTLTGIPYAVKDIFCKQNSKTTCASNILANFIAPYDATAVTKLNDAKGVFMGKTNMDEFAMGSSSEYGCFGRVPNPWDKTRVAGGSSGGSAAAVAARLVPYALGTDTGGSVRQPAAFCGVVGLKPTYGRVSRYGMIAYASSLDQAGIFAGRVEDVAYVLKSISGYDEKDSTSIECKVPDYVKMIRERGDLKGMKIGLPDEFVSADLNPKMKELIDDALLLMEKEGAQIVPVQLPNLVHAIACYYTICLAEASANLARYDGVRYGLRSKDIDDIHSLYIKSRGEGFGNEVKKRILLGTYVLTTGYYDAYYLKAQKVRRMIRDDFTKAYEKVDVIAGPVSPSPAFKQGEKSDPVSMYLQDIYTVSANLAGVPAISVPMGFMEGLPVGLQLLAPQFMEESILSVGHVYQSVSDWHTKMPPVVDIS